MPIHIKDTLAECIESYLYKRKCVQASQKTVGDSVYHRRALREIAKHIKHLKQLEKQL